MTADRNIVGRQIRPEVITEQRVTHEVVRDFSMLPDDAAVRVFLIRMGQYEAVFLRKAIHDVAGYILDTEESDFRLPASMRSMALSEAEWDDTMIIAGLTLNQDKGSAETDTFRAFIFTSIVTDAINAWVRNDSMRSGIVVQLVDTTMGNFRAIGEEARTNRYDWLYGTPTNVGVLDSTKYGDPKFSQLNGDKIVLLPFYEETLRLHGLPIN